MVSKDQAIGWIILIVCIIVIIGYPTALYVWPEWQFILVAVPVTIAIILVFAIGAWIGWTLATTPPPKPIEEIEAEIEEEKEETATETASESETEEEAEEEKKGKKKE